MPSGYAPYGYPQHGGAPREFAGFWVRFGAHLLDGLLYGLLMVPIGVVGIVLIVQSMSDCDRFERFDGTTQIDCGPGQLAGGVLAAGVVVLIAGFVLVAYLYLRHLARTGQTWGRKIVGVKVVNSDDGGPPGWGKAIGRTLFKHTISGWICWLGFLWMLWDADKQTWHDKVAGTYVVSA